MADSQWYVCNVVLVPPIFYDGALSFYQAACANLVARLRALTSCSWCRSGRTAPLAHWLTRLRIRPLPTWATNSCWPSMCWKNRRTTGGNGNQIRRLSSCGLIPFLRLLRLLADVQLSYLLERRGGWAAEENWEDVLSLGEQQRLGMARLLFHAPRFGVLDQVCVHREEEVVCVSRDGTNLNFLSSLSAPTPLVWTSRSTYTDWRSNKALQLSPSRSVRR